ncbi:MAG: hypothetical protein IPM38_13780 [Ignavibacteria bacterium]|nr:hypothetical protein [Ignavibacteria bacterium]
MRNMYCAILFTLTTALFCSGCTASKQEVKSEKSEGIAVTYPVNRKDAWEISKKVLYWEDCDDITESQYLGYMLTEISSSFFIADGCVVGVWVDSLSADSTKVTVLSKRKKKTQMGKSFTENDFHTSFVVAADYLKNGQEIPVDRP